MKRLIIFSIVMVMLSCIVSAQETRYNITKDNYNELTIEFSFGTPSAQDVMVAGQPFTLLNLAGCMASGAVGEPNCPVFSSLVEIPLCNSINLVWNQQLTYDTISLSALGGHYQLAPVQPDRSKADTSRAVLVMNHKTYATDAFVGNEVATVRPMGIARDRNLAQLEVSPIQYNPTTGQIIVLKSLTLTLHYEGANEAATREMYEKYYSPAFAPAGNIMNSLYSAMKSGTAPVRYLIISNPMFRGQLDEFIAWKKRRGFITDIVYTDNAAVGATTTSIASYIKSQYTNATATNPAPTYLLFVGDVDQLPPFIGTTDTTNPHVTDLYYATWTEGDYIPDCYYGRFSAQTIDQLTPQIEKTLMYEQYTFADPSFLNRAVMVAGVDGGNVGDFGYNYADPAMDYAINHYINSSRDFRVIYYKNNPTRLPSGAIDRIGSSAASNAATVVASYNEGAGWINYSAHGGDVCWGTPNFSTSDVHVMTNHQKFGFMVGNCCVTNKFQVGECFGESLLRKGDYCGAVAYIGCSNNSYWSHDFYWAIGVRSDISANMSLTYRSSALGAYDRLCHTHSETQNKWVTTAGAIIWAGNIAVESCGYDTHSKKYYWEIYHLMGDPSVMPYLTQPSPMTVAAPNVITQGTTSLQVRVAPYAYVALTDSTNHNVIASAEATSGGIATLTLPTSLAVGSYELVASAQQYVTSFAPLKVMASNARVASLMARITDTHPIASDSVRVTVTLKNISTEALENIKIYVHTDCSYITFSQDTMRYANLSPNGTILINSMFVGAINDYTPDLTEANIWVTADFDNASIISTSKATAQIYAPKLVAEIQLPNRNILPSNDLSATIKITNTGHATFFTGSCTFTSPTAMLASTATDAPNFNINKGASVVRSFTIHALNNMPTNTLVPLYLDIHNNKTALFDTTAIFVGSLSQETFEGSTFAISGWTSSTNTWVFDATNAHQGNKSLRSATITHHETSEKHITYTSSIDDSISFFYKVSSENNYDWFRFYIDGTEKLKASGEVDWTRVSFPVTAGSHTYKFEYKKDYSENRGSDCAWIDDVIFPLKPKTAQYLNDTICRGNAITLNNQTITLNADTSFVTRQTSTLVQITDYHVINRIIDTNYVEACNNYTINNNTYTESTTITDTINMIGHCEHLRQIILNIGHTNTTFDTITACDNYTLNGTIYTQSSWISDTTPNINGCDSVNAILLTINHSTLDTLTLSACDQYTFHNQTYTASTTILDTNQNLLGCDSITAILLTINHSSSNADTITACDNYTWDGQDYTESLDFINHDRNQYGCDSITTISIIIHHATSDTLYITDTAYTYLWNDTPITISGTYTDTLSSTFGCDSIITLVLTLIRPTEDILNPDFQNLYIFPTPTSNIVHFSQMVQEADLFDLSGRHLQHHTNTNQISLSNLPNGIYTLKITANNQIFIFKVIKQ